MTSPSYCRSEKELLAPFMDPQSAVLRAGLQLVTHMTEEKDWPPYSTYQSKKDEGRCSLVHQYFMWNPLFIKFFVCFSLLSTSCPFLFLNHFFFISFSFSFLCLFLVFFASFPISSLPPSFPCILLSSCPHLSISTMLVNRTKCLSPRPSAFGLLLSFWFRSSWCCQWIRGIHGYEHEVAFLRYSYRSAIRQGRAEICNCRWVLRHDG